MDDKKIGEALLTVYNSLYAYYGPQHWWPAEEPFEVIVGAILTQSTAWSNVEKAINNLKTAGKLSPEGIRKLTHAELADLIRPSGYFNAKAEKIQAFVRWFGERCNDRLEELLSEETGRMREQLLDIYGIGEETADSILLYAAERPVFVIDAYTRRFIERIGLTPDTNTYAAYQALFTENLPADSRMFNEYHALLVRLGKDACRKRPLCKICGLNTPATGASGTCYPCSSIIHRNDQPQ
jgi:endonuclease-3 related protein